MPRGPWVYIGTSDEEYREDLDHPLAHAPEIAELLEMTRDCFPEAGLELKDVRAFWAGIRPLIFEAGKSTRDTSRHDEVWVSPPGLVTVAGGKLTTYRPMAHRILVQVQMAMREALPGVERTAEVPLPGAPGEAIESYRLRMSDTLARRGIPPATVERLHFLYGTEVEELLAFGDEDDAWLAPLSPSLPALRGEVRLAVERSMALHLGDVLDRRMALLLFSADGGESGVVEAASIMGEILGWAEERRNEEIRAYREILRGHRPSIGTPVARG
jgi:glycerol-3-phosphate dehydrogenase